MTRMMGGQPAAASFLRYSAALAGFLLAAAMIVLSTVAASAQEQSLTVNLVGFSSDDAASSDLTITVLDRDARPLVDLSAADFTVQLDGEPALVSGLERGVDSTLPISVLLALDVSGSMDGGALDEAKAAAGRFVDGLEPQDSVAVATFADEVSLVLPFTQDREAARAAIGGLIAEGQTALYQATDEGLRLAADQGTGYRAVVLLSDGLDNGSSVTREDALAGAATLGVPVFAIGLGEDIDRAYLQALAVESGGRFAETPSPAGLATLYEEAAVLLRGQYILTLDTSSSSFVPSEPAALQVDVSSAGRAGSATRSFCGQDLCVALRQIESGQQLEAAQTVTAEVISSQTVASVSFLIDGAVVLELSEPPYEFTLDPGVLESGGHALSVTANTAAGTSQTSEITLEIAGTAGGFSTMLLLGGAAVVVAAGAVVLVVMLWSRRRRGPKGRLRKLDPSNLRPPFKGGALLGDEPDQRLWPDAAVQAAGARTEARGRLYVSGGSFNGDAFPVGGSPLSIGSGDTCGIRLSSQAGGEEEITSEYIRAWVRDDELMIHEVRRIAERGPEGGRWAKLEPGDEFTVGPYTLRFELGDEEDAPEAVPNVLRDDDAGVKERNPTGAANGFVREIDEEPSGIAQAAEPVERDDPAHDVGDVPHDVPNILRDKENVREPERGQAEDAARDVGRDAGVVESTFPPFQPPLDE